MSEKMTTANSAEQGKVDIDFAECAVPKWSRRRFVTMFMIMLGFTFFSASMWVGQEMAAGLDFWGFIKALLLGGAILGIYTGLLGYVGAETGLSLDLLSKRAFGEKGSYISSALFEKCIIYDGGARRYEIHEHVEEVLEFWEGIEERADKIDFKELLDEKLGYPTPISYEDWIKANHYQKIRPADAKWLYRQELGYIESMKGITLKELAEQRIGEFTDALRKYILD